MNAMVVGTWNIAQVMLLMFLKHIVSNCGMHTVSLMQPLHNSALDFVEGLSLHKRLSTRPDT